MKIIHKHGAIFLLLFFLAAYLIPLGTQDLIAPDETRYGEIPREMVSSGDWVVPRLNGVRYFEKPTLGYWVHAGSLLIFGENNFAVRLPSALAVGLSALLIFALVRRVPRQETGEDGFLAPLAVLVYLGCLEVFAVGNAAVLDSLFSFFLTATITAFYMATECPPGSRKEKGFLLLSGLACGLAFLTKGFLSFAVPVLALVPYLLWQRRYADLLRMSWLPILSAILVALPWSLAIHGREPDFWRFFFWNEHIRRFMADDAQHKASFWYFFLTAPGMFLPWTFVAPAAVAGLIGRISKQDPQGRLLRFAICWLAFPFLFFSLSNGKLLTYILPCFPPFAVLMAFGLFQVLRENPRQRLVQWGVLLSAVFFGLILSALLYVQIFSFNGIRPFNHPFKLMMIAVGLFFSLLFFAGAFRSRIGKDKVLFYGTAPLLLFFVVHYAIPVSTLEVRAPGPFIEQHARGLADADVIIADEDSIGAVCWYLQRSDVYVLGVAGELEYGLGYKEAQGRLLGTRSAADLIRRHRGKAVLIARVKRICQWADQLPMPVFQDQNGSSGYVIWKY